MAEEDQQQQQYEKSLGLASNKTLINLYPSKAQAQTWTEEAESNNFPNRNRYLIELINEARAYRQNEIRGPGRAEQRIQQLQSEVERLREQLEKERQTTSGRVEFDDPEFINQFLTDNYQPLSDILQQIVESGALNDLIRKEIEDQLYFMAGQDVVKYERGWGWKLVDGGGA